jgi:CRISPR-associated endonuclease/helicase Cas3
MTPKASLIPTRGWAITLKGLHVMRSAPPTGVDAGFTIIESELLGRAVALAAALHDLGKATTFFQNYLLTDEPFDNDLKAHAKLSAIVTRSLLSEMIKNSVQDPVLRFYLPLITFLAVKRHHGNLDNLGDENYVLRQAKRE